MWVVDFSSTRLENLLPKMWISPLQSITRLNSQFCYSTAAVPYLWMVFHHRTLEVQSCPVTAKRRMLSVNPPPLWLSFWQSRSPWLFLFSFKSNAGMYTAAWCPSNSIFLTCVPTVPSTSKKKKITLFSSRSFCLSQSISCPGTVSVYHCFHMDSQLTQQPLLQRFSFLPASSIS